MTIARTVSETFFLVFSHATCSGVSHTLTRSVLRSATPTSESLAVGCWLLAETPRPTANGERPTLLADFMLPVGNPKILVVEDDDRVRRLLAENLTEQMPVDVDSARDGVEALHKISTKAYSAVILDLMMPKMSGVDFLDSLRALTHDPSVKALETPPPVLVITSAPAASISDSVIRNRCPGVVRAVFRKPLDIAALAVSVKKYLR